jgi:hypothetical protein
MNNSSTNSILRQMTGNAFEHLTGQALHDTYRHQVIVSYSYSVGNELSIHMCFCIRNCTDHCFFLKNHMGNNSGSVGLQRMDGSTFRYFSQQSTHNVSEQVVIINNLLFCQLT